MLNCIDNTGAALVECAMVVGQKRHARIGSKPLDPFFRLILANRQSGDRIVVVVQKQRSDVTTSPSGGGSSGAGGARVKRGDVRQAVVVRTKYASQRPDGSVARFGDNACVLITKSGDPIGTRVNGVVGAELSRKKWSKILSMATMHV